MIPPGRWDLSALALSATLAEKDVELPDGIYVRPLSAELHVRNRRINLTPVEVSAALCQASISCSQACCFRYLWRLPHYPPSEPIQRNASLTDDAERNRAQQGYEVVGIRLGFRKSWMTLIRFYLNDITLQCVLRRFLTIRLST